jgi:hypothetical protein
MQRSPQVQRALPGGSSEPWNARDNVGFAASETNRGACGAQPRFHSNPSPDPARS